MGTLTKPCLTLLTDSTRYGEINLDLIDGVINSGVDMLQLREPSLTEHSVIEIGNLIAEITKNRALLIFNGNPTIATKINADGVQLPEKKIDVIASDIPKGLLIGRSIHSKNAAIQSDKAGTDFFIAGTIFPTASHPDIKTLGVNLITDICKVSVKPVLGIGGIDANNAESVIRAGADGVAVISSIWGSHNPKRATKSLKEKLQVNKYQ